MALPTEAPVSHDIALSEAPFGIEMQATAIDHERHCSPFTLLQISALTRRDAQWMTSNPKLALALLGSVILPPRHHSTDLSPHAQQARAFGAGAAA